MSEELEEMKLDSPLIVHKVTDASYQEMASEVSVDFTHTDSESTATLERHRYRKVKKAKKWPYVLIAVIVAAVIVITALYFSGVIKPASKNEDNTNTGYVSTTENRFAGIITVKNTYVFFEGKEIEGAAELASEIKYLESGTKFVVQDEKADETLLNQEIIPTLDSYGIQYEVKYVVSSGLTSKYETTEVVTDALSAGQVSENLEQ